MNIDTFLRSVIEQDEAAVLLCDLDHTVIYMNNAAKKRYAYAGGEKLLGSNLLNCHNEASRSLIEKCVEWFAESPTHNRVFESHNPNEYKDVYIVALRDESGALIGYYEKHEYRSLESAKPYTFS